MLAGLLLTSYYIVRLEIDPGVASRFGNLHMEPWFHLQSTSAGVFGVAAGFIVTVVVSLFTKPEPGTEAFLEKIRFRNRDQT